MRSDGNVYHPIPEKVPKVRNAVEFEQMKTRATELACDIRLHRSVTLPPNEDTGRTKPIRVTYSDVGYSDVDDPENVPVILWASGMFGGRYHGFAYDDLCKKHRVRFLAIDRSGIGGTDLVSLDQRVQIWLEAVPAVLKQAGVKHVHLVSHSAGIIYMLNTMLHLRHLLSPTRPFAAFFGPWVHPSKSGKFGLSVISALPELAIGTWHHWAKLMSSTIAPVLTAAGINATKAFKQPATIPLASDQVTEDSKIGDGVDTTWRKASEAVISHFIYAENMEGASQEALLCLRKGVTWGDWPDIDEAVLRIARQERDLREADQQSRKKLQVQLYFAEHDEMSGPTGQSWLESCFKHPEVSDFLQVESQVVAGSDHNNILSLKSGAMEKMVKTIAEVSYASPHSEET